MLHQDAAELKVTDELDGVLFSLSYSVIPDPRPALAAEWRRLRPFGRLVVMDLGLTNTALGGFLKPIASLLSKLAPGNAYSAAMERPLVLRVRRDRTLPAQSLLRVRRPKADGPAILGSPMRPDSRPLRPSESRT